MSNNQTEHNLPKPGPSKWLQFFLAFNLAILIGMFIWEVGGSSFKSDAEIGQIYEKQGKDIEKALSQNPTAIDYTGRLSDVVELIVDATDPNAWLHFNFRDGKQFKKDEIATDSIEWDIAFRRAKIISNGGVTNKKGIVEVAVVQTSDFESVSSAPHDGYVADLHEGGQLEAKSRPELDKWYKYDLWTHKLDPKKIVYVIKTSDGRYAKFQITGYYCGTAAGCFALRYKYQGEGGTSFTE
jgi:hypothetical protein